MTRFPSAGHLVSWVGLCPRLDESAGKRRSTRIRNATPWLWVALIQAAWAATRKPHSEHRGDEWEKVELTLLGRAHDAGEDLLRVDAVTGAIDTAHPCGSRWHGIWMRAPAPWRLRKERFRGG